MKHELGLEGTVYSAIQLATNTEPFRVVKDYEIKLIISDEILEFLNQVADMEISSKGVKHYIINKQKYRYLGVKIPIPKLSDL